MYSNPSHFAFSKGACCCRRLRFAYGGLEGLLGRKMLILKRAVAPKMSALLAAVAHDAAHARVGRLHLLGGGSWAPRASEFTVASPRPQGAGNALIPAGGAGVARLCTALGRSGPDLNEPFIRPSRQRRLVLNKINAVLLKGRLSTPQCQLDAGHHTAFPKKEA